LAQPEDHPQLHGKRGCPVAASQRGISSSGIPIYSPISNRTVDAGEKLSMYVCLRQVTMFMRENEERGGIDCADKEKPTGRPEFDNQILNHLRRNWAAALC
jgi:hypothetical protein